MEAVSSPKVVNLTFPKTEIHASELLSTFEHYAGKIKVLSLDCFDTIIWRKTATPSDLFYDMAARPAFKNHDFTALMRIRAEVQARKDMMFNYGKNEIKLQDIYRASLPALTTEQLDALVQAELAAEHDTSYAFPPVVELIRNAHARGLKIIVVSDTYLAEEQLRDLLKSKLPDDVMAAIDHVFCSSEVGISKVNGLFKPILQKLNVAANAVLHVGDNRLSDFYGAKSAGCHALQLILHHEQTFNDMQRMHTIAASILDPTIRNKRSLSSPYHGVFASNKYSYSDAKTSIGYTTVGPIMFSFARFICDEVAHMKQQGKNPKVLFLLRDAYLPYLACETLADKTIGHCVSISRFASYAAGFRNKEKINRYVADTVESLRFRVMCDQLLIPEPHATDIVTACENATNAILEFVRQINAPHILQLIMNESAAYRKRLYGYLEKHAGIKRGDTIIFVDLGYTGTTQRELQPIFKEEMDIDIIGRYLIQLSIPEWAAARKGLMDPSCCDDRTLNMLVAYIALLEQISTSNTKSVVNYAENGNPIFLNSGISEQQYAKLNAIQAECLRFIRDAKTFFHLSNTTIEQHHLRDGALTALGRLIFLPSAVELDYLQSFEFDLSLGTKDLIKVVDVKAGLTGLRKRGISFMEKNLKTMRTNYPSELRSASLELVLMLMGHYRFGYDLKLNDMSHRREQMQIIVMNGIQATQTTIEAMPTYDGYFSLIAPVGTSNFQLGILFGLNYHWVQLESAELIKANQLFTATESENTQDASSYLAIDRMVDKGGGIFECQSDTGMVVFAGPKMTDGEQYALRIVFRPLVKREVVC